MKPKNIVLVPLLSDRPEDTLVLGVPLNGSVPDWDEAISFDFPSFISFLGTVAQHGYALSLDKDDQLILKAQRRLLA